MTQYTDDGFEIPDDWRMREYVTIDDILDYASGMSIYEFNQYLNMNTVRAQHFKNAIMKKNLEKLKERIQRGEVIRTWEMP